MKKVVLDSLNTTVSNSPPSKIFVRTPLGAGNKLFSKQLNSSCSLILDARGTKLAQSEQGDLTAIENEQLKKENRLLRRKVDDLMGDSRLKLTRNGKRHAEQGSKRPADDLTISVDGFLEEVNASLESLTKLFKTEGLGESEKRQIAQKQGINKNILQYSVLSKKGLEKSIQGIMAEEEGARFSKMVELFGEYYVAQEQRDKRMVEKVEKMTATVRQLVTEASPTKSQSSIEYYSPLLTSVTTKNLEMSRTQPFARTIHTRNRTSLEACDLASAKFFKRSTRQQTEM